MRLFDLDFEVDHEVWQNTILLGTVGSTVHGLNNKDGTEDHDLMGVCIEPFHRVVGFNENVERWMLETYDAQWNLLECFR
jgi:predicted nucleotidyltransferase